MRFLRVSNFFLMICLLAIVAVLSGCGGKKGGGSDEAKIRSLIEQTPILEGLGIGEEDQSADAKYLIEYTSIVRSGTSATREIQSVNLSGNVASVSCLFKVSGDLNFKDDAGAVVARKPIMMQGRGIYTLEKNVSGDWSIVSYPEYSLTLAQGETPTVELNLSKNLLLTGETLKITAQITSSPIPCSHITFRINKLGLKALLLDAGDGIYTQVLEIPSDALAGNYVGLLDVIDEIKSFDLTKDSGGNYTSPYTGCMQTTKITISIPGSAEAEVEEARDILFGQTDNKLSEEEFDSAFAHLQTALSQDPNNPDANFLWSLAKIVDEWDRIADLTENSEDYVFPFTNGIIGKAAPAVAKLIDKSKINSPSIVKNLISDPPKPVEVQGELENVLPVFDDIISHLEKVKEFFLNNPYSGLRIPKDIFDPSQGIYNIDEGDIHLLLAAFYCVKGWSLYGLSYYIDDGGFFDLDPVDSSSDGYLQPEEYLPTGNFGTLKSDGEAKLQSAKVALIKFAEELNLGIEKTLSESPPAVLEPLTSEQIQKIQEEKEGVLQFKSSMEGNAVTVNAEPDWGVKWTSIEVKLSELFDNPPQDWRETLPDFNLGMSGPRVEKGELFGGDNTLSGVFPGGIDLGILEDIKVTPATVSLEVGGTQQFTATGIYWDGSTADISTSVTWWLSSYPEGAGTIDSSGLFTALSSGTAYVNVTFAGRSSEPAVVTVVGGEARQKIAFASTRDGNGEIYIMNVDGSGQTRLTNNSADDWGPSFSPDGTKIAFASYRDGNQEIYIMNVDGSGQTRLTNNSAWEEYPCFSPDGTKIAFASDRDGNGEIYIMNVDGSGQTRLTNNNTSDWEPSFSPDGTKIAFSSDGEIYIMNVDGSGQTRLTNNTACDEFPSFSPDGTKIAFDSDRDGNYEIYIMNVDGSGQTNLTSNSAGDFDPIFLDATKIAFCSDRDGDYEIYIMNVDGSGQTNLTNNSAGEDGLPGKIRGAKRSLSNLSALVYNVPALMRELRD